MKTVPPLALAVAFLLLAGCQKSSESPKAPTTGQQPQGASTAKGVNEAEVQANLAKLDPEDRKFAEEQKFCAVLNDNRLGSMGTPAKIMLKDEPVFLCCKGCAKKAQSNPDQTLAKVKELKAKNAPAPEKSSGKVSLLRVPNGGIQPQTMVDGRQRRRPLDLLRR